MSLSGQTLARQVREARLALPIIGVLLALFMLVASPAWARKPTAESLGSVVFASLPREAQATDRLVRAGGPFPYPKDGIVFGNRERVLPAQPRGYYREYTVQTPGARDRGARRLVCGGQQPTRPDHCFYTGDHYATFSRVVY